MKLGNDQSFVEFAFVQRAPENSPGAGDVSCSVIAAKNAFRGGIPSVWFSREDLDDFLRQLEQLERTRNGLVKLSNLSSLSDYNPLTLEIFSIDHRGNLGVKVELLRLSYDWDEQEPLKMSISFPIDGERFGEVVAGFRKFFG